MTAPTEPLGHDRSARFHLSHQLEYPATTTDGATFVAVVNGFPYLAVVCPGEEACYYCKAGPT
jgi:hypothetical protein